MNEDASNKDKPAAPEPVDEAKAVESATAETEKPDEPVAESSTIPPEPEPAPADTGKTGYSNRIFLVCRDAVPVKKKIIQFLEGLSLLPVPIPNQLDAFKAGGEQDPHADIGFAIIVLSGDDFVYNKNSKPAEAKLRAEQETVLKLGYLMGKFERKRLFVMHYEQKSFVFPGSFIGPSSTPFNTNDEWKTVLIRRLEACGYRAK